MGSGGKIIIIFVLVLFFATFFISYFDKEINGYTNVKTIDLPRGQGSFSQSDDLKTSCNMTKYEMDGSWSCSGSGLSLSGSGSFLVPLTQKSNDGKYTSSYHISSHPETFYIVIAETNYDNYIHLKFEPDKVYIPKVISAGWLGRYEYGVAWYAPIDTTPQDLQIDITYDSNYNEATISINGQEFYIPPETMPSNSMMPEVITSTSGISSDGDLTLDSISYSFEERITEIGGLLDALGMVIPLGYSMLRLATYTFPYDIIPLTVQVGIIFPIEFAITMGVAIFFREG